MNMYRIKQFYIYIKDKMEYSDEKFIDKHLNNYEKRLFNRLSMKDQKHCVRVAYDVEKICINHKGDIDTNKLIKAALLHDIGKIEFGLNVLDKSILVIWIIYQVGKLKNFQSPRK
ncbi:HD domain-containing protein [Clostridium tetanomorphum]|uniref:HD domain-containing protein n=1 Tax=Clostridium tetanomorphum TaxID=1553 RepID=UPI000DA0B821|nr:putative domain HDIG-containing protein [Clostridium tetanomorphum]